LSVFKQIQKQQNIQKTSQHDIQQVNHINTNESKNSQIQTNWMQENGLRLSARITLYVRYQEYNLTSCHDSDNNQQFCSYIYFCTVVQCFDAVGWAAGRASGL